MPNSRERPAPSSALLWAAVAWVAATGGVGAQEGPVSAADSSAIVEDVRERQERFERFRASRIPVERQRNWATCDQWIGRICIWFGEEEESSFPEEPVETERARSSLIGSLIQAYERIDDPWVTGQLVHYLVEHGDLATAERAARRCAVAETWWCSALLGFVLHVKGDYVAAEDAFRNALAAMPPDERARWLGPRYVVSQDARREIMAGSPEEAARRWELFWRLSDPLFMREGNDRLTEHFARLVVARNRSDALDPQLMGWDEDLEETLVRYGRIIGWSRTHDPGAMMRGGRVSVQDTRRVIGHHHPKSRGYLFPEGFLESPSDVPPESWITAPRAARTWYAPPYAGDFRALETQVGRFRRGDEMLVVGAYRPVPLAPPAERPADWSPDPAIGYLGAVQSALVLVPVEPGPQIEVTGNEPSGVFTLRAPPGRYVGSLEVLEPEAHRAWRARQGVRQDPLVPGLVGVSDLLILQEGAPTPASLDEAIPHVRPGIRVRPNERLKVVWEVYGLDVTDPVRVTLGFTRGRPGFLERVGEFLGVLEPDRAVEITFDDATPDQVQALFRSIELELPDVEPGEYTLHLRLDLPGREPSIASRPIVVER